MSDTAPRETPLYTPDPGLFDEAVAADGSPRPPYAELLAALGEADLEELSAAIASEVRRHGVSFRADGRTESFHLDPVPRLLAATEWAELERGLRQRVRALDQFVADVYGERRIIAEGVVPEWALEGCDHLEKKCEDRPAARDRDRLVAVDYGLLDRDGELLGNPYSHRDRRTDGIVARVLEVVSAEDLFAVSGLQQLPFNTVFQLAAARGTAALAAAKTLLLSRTSRLLAHRRDRRRAHERLHHRPVRRHDPRLVARAGRPARPAVVRAAAAARPR